MIAPEFLASIIEKADAPILACDAAGRLAVANAAARELAPNGELPREHPIFRGLRGETVCGMEMVVAPFDAPARTVRVSVEPLHDDAGAIIGAVATYHPLSGGHTGGSAQGELLRPEPARGIAEREHWRSAFTADASRILSSSLDPEAGLRELARFAVPQFADCCSIDILEETGARRRLAIAHTDPAKAELAWDLDRRYPPEPDDPLLRVLRSGRSELAEEISETLLEAISRDAEHFGLLRGLGFRSYIIVPLGAPGRVLGAVTFVSAESGRRYSNSDLALAEELASRASLAVENARLRALAEDCRCRAEASQKQLGLLLESTGEGIYGIDMRGLCTFVNGSAAAILGYAREELLGKNMHEVAHFADATGAPFPVENCPIYNALAEGRGTRVDDEVFFRGDGSSFPVEYASYPIVDAGAVLGAVVTFTDITALKRAEEQLRASEAKYRGLFEHVSEGVYQTSPNGELLAANPALVQMLGFASELELRALDVNDLYADPEDRQRLTEKIDREGRLANVELRLRRKDGRIINVIENARAVRGEDKSVAYYEGTLTLRRGAV